MVRLVRRDAHESSHTENGETLLTGDVIDQAALHGLLNRLHDIGIPLISVNPVEKSSGGSGTDGDEYAAGISRKPAEPGGT